MSTFHELFLQSKILPFGFLFFWVQGCQNKFYMPHMLTVDSRSNVWVTDVAMHQVFRIPQREVFGGDCQEDKVFGHLVSP